MWSGIFNNYIDDVFSLWDCKRNEVGRFIEQAYTFYPTIKFTAEISENEITFLDTVVFKGERFIKKIHPRHQNSLQADGNLSIYPVYFVPPSRAKKRL